MREYGVSLLPAGGKVVGIKQVARAAEAGALAEVYLAADADDFIAADVKRLCRDKKIPLRVRFTREELGRFCRIDVKAAVVGIERAPAREE
jgi:large subunit ribosomal protein L7A